MLIFSYTVLYSFYWQGNCWLLGNCWPLLLHREEKTGFHLLKSVDSRAAYPCSIFASCLSSACTAHEQSWSLCALTAGELQLLCNLSLASSGGIHSWHSNGTFKCPLKGSKCRHKGPNTQQSKYESRRITSPHSVISVTATHAHAAGNSAGTSQLHIFLGISH